MEPILIFWLVVGGLLLLGELLLPAFILIFYSVAAFITAGLVYTDIAVGWPQAIGAFILISLIMLLIGQLTLGRMFRAEIKTVEDDHETRHYGQLVRVTKTISPENDEGRIRYDGTTWPATSIESIIPAGGEAVIQYEHNSVYLVRGTDMSRLEGKYGKNPPGGRTQTEGPDPGGWA